MRNIVLAATLFAALSTVGPLSAFAQPAAPPDACNQPLPDAIAQVTLDSTLRNVVTTRDGCWIFATMRRSNLTANGIAVLRRTGGTVAQVHFHPLPGTPSAPTSSLSLTHDERVLVARVDRQVVFIDVAALIAGSGKALLGALGDQHFAPQGATAITADDKYLFVSQNASSWITVIDLEKARRSDFDPSAIIGGIPLTATGSLVLSPDSRTLYSFGGVAEGNAGWLPGVPGGCRTRDQGGFLAGFLAIDVERATANAGVSSVIAGARGGCGVPSLTLSPDGNRMYLAAPQDDMLIAFDTQFVRSGVPPSLIGKVPVGPAPRDVVTIDGGRKIVVLNSNTFDAGVPAETIALSYLTVIDAARVASGASAVLGTIPAGPAPNHLALTADGRTLLVTDTKSPALYIIDLDRLVLATVQPQ